MAGPPQHLQREKAAQLLETRRQSCVTRGKIDPSSQHPDLAWQDQPLQVHLPSGQLRLDQGDACPAAAPGGWREGLGPGGEC